MWKLTHFVCVYMTGAGRSQTPYSVKITKQMTFKEKQTKKINVEVVKYKFRINNYIRIF